MMDLKQRRTELDQALAGAIREWQGWGNRIQQIQGAIAENEAMQAEAKKSADLTKAGEYDEDGKLIKPDRGSHGLGDAGVSQPAGGETGPSVRPA